MVAVQQTTTNQQRKNNAFKFGKLAAVAATTRATIEEHSTSSTATSLTYEPSIFGLSKILDLSIGSTTASSSNTTTCCDTITTTITTTINSTKKRWYTSLLSNHSCMIIRTVEESTNEAKYEKRKKLYRRNRSKRRGVVCAAVGGGGGDDEEKDDNTTNNSMLTVRFDMVEIRCYPIILGDNPSVSCGPPLSIDWHPINTFTFQIDDYENTTKVDGDQREFGATLIPNDWREQLLLHEGVTKEELRQSNKEIKRIKINRLESRRLLYQFASSERNERIVRGLKNIVFAGKKRKEKEYLARSQIFDDHQRRQADILADVSIKSAASSGDDEDDDDSDSDSYSDNDHTGTA